MSSAAKAAENKPTRPGQYEVGRPGGKCSVCQQEILPGTKVMAGLRETPTGFERLDTMTECWPQVDRAQLLAFWQTVVPTHEAKKYSELPKNARAYLQKVAELTGAKLTIASVGPNRDQTIVL